MPRLLLASIFALGLTPALAQSAPSVDTPVTLTLTLGDVNTLLDIVADAPQPWKRTNPLIGKIQQQAQEQLKPKPPTGENDADPAKR